MIPEALACDLEVSEQSEGTSRVVLAAANHTSIQPRSRGAHSLSLMSNVTLDMFSLLSGPQIPH